MNSKIGSVLGYLLAVVGFAYLIYNEYIVSTYIIISIIQILAFCLMIWARLVFKRRSFNVTAATTAGGLVTSGPYKWFRHPIYISIIYFSWVCFIAFTKLDVLMAVMLVSGGLYARMILEEKELNAAYPEYAAYTKQAKRLIPFVY